MNKYKGSSQRFGEELYSGRTIKGKGTKVGRIYGSSRNRRKYKVTGQGVRMADRESGTSEVSRVGGTNSTKKWGF